MSFVLGVAYRREILELHKAVFLKYDFSRHFKGCSFHIDLVVCLRRGAYINNKLLANFSKKKHLLTGINMCFFRNFGYV